MDSRRRGALTDRLRPSLFLRSLALALAIAAKMDAATIEDYQTT